MSFNLGLRVVFDVLKVGLYRLPHSRADVVGNSMLATDPLNNGLKEVKMAVVHAGKQVMLNLH